MPLSLQAHIFCISHSKQKHPAMPADTQTSCWSNADAATVDDDQKNEDEDESGGEDEGRRDTTKGCANKKRNE